MTTAPDDALALTDFHGIAGLLPRGPSHTRATPLQDVLWRRRSN